MKLYKLKYNHNIISIDNKKLNLVKNPVIRVCKKRCFKEYHDSLNNTDSYSKMFVNIISMFVILSWKIFLRKTVVLTVSAIPNIQVHLYVSC